MDAYPGTIESYSSVKVVHGALEEPSGSSEVPSGALEAHTNNSEADFGVCRHIYCYYEPPSLQGQPPYLQGEPS